MGFVEVQYSTSMIHILVPLYNGIEFLNDSIPAILNQTHKEWMLYIGVNGQPNAKSDTYNQVMHFLEPYKHDTRIRVLDLFYLKGKPMTMNTMLRFIPDSTKGETQWVCVCDVDDIWLPTKLESQLPYMNTYDVIGTHCQYFGDLNSKPQIPVGNISSHNFYQYNPMINSSTMVKKELCYWIEHGVDDYDMWLRLWNRGCTFYNVETVQVKHRVHNDSAFNAQGNHNRVPTILKKHQIPNITFATCWYPIKSKFNVEKYDVWMKNILKHINGHFNLVVYTNQENVDKIQAYVLESKKPEYVRIVKKEFSEFYGAQWTNDWIKNHEQNHSLNQNSPYNTDWRLNMLWSEKIHFTYDAAQYFTTDYYGWMDIGYFRDTPIPSNWPLKKKIASLSQNKIYYTRVCDKNEFVQLCQCATQKNAAGLPEPPIPSNQTSIAGGFFIAHKLSLMWWHSTYYTRLQTYFRHEYLVKDDQIIILDCIAEMKHKFQLISCSSGTIYSPERWFAFYPYLLS